ncbi:MAG: hypothetical protein R2757_06680, partial [Draconibacterium sp.]
MLKRILLFLLIIMLFQNCRKSDYILEDANDVISDDGNGTGTVTWTADNEYILEGFVFVND